MKLPNPDRAVVDIRKLRDYCLNPDHPEGKHKAHVFASVLGITVSDAQHLQTILLSVANTHEVQPGLQDAYGQRYTLDFIMNGKQGRQALARSGWIVRTNEDFPRLLTCYVAKPGSET